MQHLILAALSAAVLSACLLHAESADLNSDKQALLAFAASLPHGRKLNWSSTTPLCTSWVGVTCTPDNSRVHTLRLPAVGLFGPIPSDTLSKLDALEVLSLRSNRLTVDLPPDVGSIPSLHSLFLQHNNLSGIIPTSLSSSLTFLDLSYNTFDGEIPLRVQNLTGLTAILLQNNSLSGPIPDLQLPKLRHLNVSNNNLSGPIPPSLQKFPASSFLGNAFLCGFPLESCPGTAPSPSPTSPSPMPSKTKKSFWRRIRTGVLIAVAAAAGVLLLILIIVLLVCIFKRKKHTEPTTTSSSKGKAIAGGRVENPKEDYSSSVQEAERNKLVFFEGSSYNFDLEDLLRASAEVLGKGSYGTTYKAVLEDGTVVVVKRLKEVVVGKKDFEQQMEIVGRIGQHQNVVPLRAYYYSKDEKLLVYDYVPSGSLAAVLHGNKTTGRAPLDWETRVKISLGVARGIAHLHAEGSGKFTHGNLKSSNILLSQNLDGCASEFGLAQLMSNVPAPARLIGYRAPEVMETKKPTQKSDVYSFGVLLLEMLTGKAPLRSPGRDDSVGDLPRWVQSVVREEWTAEVFDVDLLRHPNIEDEMVQLLQVAMACVAIPPEQRPKMEEVVGRITEIRNSYSGAMTPPEETAPAPP
ncbi:probable inactive receptor kinase At5g58300 isoform X2 [Brachypodium distachyon]|uniref:probable inactive receptor kinase At5g58300 isoform X2 n=1 Tax=Brachypodium distachyon TaxID=15368 RepID=UPI00071DDAFB|nr:probable inactive receptor kinase At5g58300 isoform X2 [Brachypodium distachyon]|eukprot:XP_014754698.1 probable inactive receptor kinase At5g58300 isoform X2 [Brachypodium distachyon]